MGVEAQSLQGLTSVEARLLTPVEAYPPLEIASSGSREGAAPLGAELSDGMVAEGVGEPAPPGTGLGGDRAVVN